MNLQITLRKIAILTALSLSTHEHRMSTYFGLLSSVLAVSYSFQCVRTSSLVIRILEFPILCDALVNGIGFFVDCSSLVCRQAASVCVVILVPATLPDSFNSQ